MFLLIASVFALIYWGLTLRDGHSWGRTAVKGLAVLTLLPLTIPYGAPLVALSLLLCSLGDMILSRPGERAFLGGLIAFALGHLAWIAVFLLRVGVSVQPLTNLWPLLVGFAVLVAVMVRVLLPRAGALRGPVAIYLCVIVAMSVLAFATGNRWIVLGAVCFAASDALLGMQTFALTKGSRVERGANALIWPLYWVAIVLMTLGALGT